MEKECLDMSELLVRSSEYKKVFIDTMCLDTRDNSDEALNMFEAEYSAVLEDSEDGEKSNPMDDARECMTYWD